MKKNNTHFGLLWESAMQTTTIHGSLAFIRKSMIKKITKQNLNIGGVLSLSIGDSSSSASRSNPDELYETIPPEVYNI